MKIRIVLLLLVAASLSRMLPHPPNFTPIAAMGLLGAAYMDKRWMAYVLPFATLFFTDLVLNNTVYAYLYDGFTWITSIWIYLAFGLVIAIGRMILQGTISGKHIALASLVGSTIFFLVSNYYSWQFFPFYPKTFGGLMSCYAAGIPFFGYTLLGDLVYSFALFGAYALIVPKLQAQKA
jgi:hypothetical protein